MPTTIPYDPSLSLASIVPAERLVLLINIAKAQEPIDAAEEALNSAIMTLRSLEMTMMEVMDMGVDMSDMNGKYEQAKQNVKSSAKELVTQRVQGFDIINKLKEQVRKGKVSATIESPVDFNRTQIKQMPLSADSLKMDGQYFSFDGDKEASNNSIKALKSFISGATSFLGDKVSAETTSSAQSQVAQQRENHDVQGTLVITASCTHKNVALLAPFHLDVDKAIRVWNTIYKNEAEIKVNSLESMQRIAKKQETENEKTLNIISGATYGSSFIGMVHVLRSESTQVRQKMESVASSLQSQMELGSWFADASGGFGVDSQFANDVKKLLSTQEISSHISVLTVGMLPSIKSNEVQIGVKQFTNFDPAEMMNKLATLSNATAAEEKTVGESAEKARTGEKMIQIRSAEVKGVMSGLGAVDDGKNKLMDINSLMTAFDDYIEKILSGTIEKIGAPVNYYIKPITASELAQMWVAKYYPGQYVTAAGDDGTPNEPNKGSNTSAKPNEEQGTSS